MYYSYVEIEYVASSFSPARTDLALKLLRLLVSKLTTRVTSQALKWEIIFLPIWSFFSSLSSCWFYIRGGEWRMPPRKVSYKCTFGAPDQGQMLDVWYWHSADVNTEVAVTPGVTTSPRKDTLNTTRYLHRNLCQSMRSYKLDLGMDPVQWSPCTLTPI